MAGLLLHPRAILVYAVILFGGWAFQQGRHFEQWANAKAIARANAQAMAVNERETALREKEDALRDKAFSEAKPVLAIAGKCLVTQDVADALNRIR